MNRAAITAILVPLLAGLMFGQEPPPGPEPLPQEVQPKIQLNNITLEQFALSVQKRTKKVFLYGEPVAQLMRAGRVQLMSFREFADKEQLFSLFQSILQVQAQKLVLIPAGEDIYKIVPENEALKRGPDVVGEVGTPRDSFVTRIFSLKYVSAQEAFQALVNLAMPQAVTQIPASAMIIVTDTDYNIRRIEAVIKAIDLKKEDMIWKVIPLKKAVAADVEQMLRTLLQGIVAQARARPGFAPNVPGNEQVTAVADRRTNSILILAEPGRVEQIQNLVESLDKDPEFETSGTYLIPLRHRDADDMATILNGIYGRASSTTGTSTGYPTSGTGQTARPNQPITPAPVGPTPGFYSGGGQQAATSEPTIIADKKSNSLIVVTDRNTYQMLLRLSQRLDRRRPQVLIKASVVEVQANSTFDLGMELNRAVDPTGRLTGFERTNMGFSTVVPSGNTVNIVPTDTVGITLALLKDRFGNIGALFKAVEDKAKVTIIDEPEVATEDNKQANITLANTVQVPKVTVAGNGLSQTSFDPLTANTTLTITPHITEGGYLRLETEVEIAKFVSTGAASNAPPNTTNRKITTGFLMPSSRTAVIGGIMTSDKTESETGVPVLKDIPLFGFLFRRTRDVDVRRTLYIFITPYILYDESFGDLSDMTQAHLDDILFAGDQKYPGLLERMSAKPPVGPKPRSNFQFPRKAEK